MARLLGIVVLLVALYGLLYQGSPDALSEANLFPVAINQGYFIILTLGAGVLIISGGIDLSIGSVVALTAVAFGTFCRAGYPPWVALGAVLFVGAGIGLLHGVLVTWLRLQPFLVTLCGLFAYRGLARYFSAGSADASGEGNIRLSDLKKAAPEGHLPQFEFFEWVATGRLDLFGFALPVLLVLALGLALALAVFLHGSVAGRYLFAIGGNEDAARYAGVRTVRYKLLAYVLCSTLAALGGVLELFVVETIQPASAGEFYELYAITGAVLGGCSLTGGEGNVFGLVLGASVLPLLLNLPTWYKSIPVSLQSTIIGGVLLLGTIADQWFKYRASRRK